VIYQYPQYTGSVYLWSWLSLHRVILMTPSISSDLGMLQQLHTPDGKSSCFELLTI